MLKIRQSWDRLIFNMGIPILGKVGLYIEKILASSCPLATNMVLNALPFHHCSLADILLLNNFFNILVCAFNFFNTTCLACITRPTRNMLWILHSNSYPMQQYSKNLSMLLSSSFTLHQYLYCLVALPVQPITVALACSFSGYSLTHWPLGDFNENLDKCFSK